jgi:hypothetical protein
MTTKTTYTLMHTGRPYGPCESIPDSAWRPLSTHASLKAAIRAKRSHTAHLSPGSWDDHYYIQGPDGKPVSDAEYDKLRYG